MKQESFFAVTMSLLLIAAGLTIVFLKFWVIGSLITSGIKPLAGMCDQTLVVERVLDGHWFCPDKEQK